MSRIALRTKIDAFDALHQLAQSQSKRVSVNTQDLLNLLMDHSELASVAEARGCTIVENKPRPRFGLGA